jgi:uncharacterized membrane protein YphA (DoxX/SURF4 family)
LIRYFEKFQTALNQSARLLLFPGEKIKFINALCLFFKPSYMNSIQHLYRWGDAHHPRYMDILRIALGVFLCYKGIEFGRSDFFPSTLSNQVPFSGFMLMLIQHFIIFAHIAGGFMIATGLLTRLACMAQIPILVGALIFANWNMMDHFSDFIIALVVLGLLIYFFIIGSGPFSLDRALEREELQ